MKLIYIAGPFRGATAWDVEQNVRRAEALALSVWRIGAAALCPHTNTRFFDKSANDKAFLAGTMEMLRRCDGMILVRDWEHSSGTRAEIAEALRLHIPIFGNILRLNDFVKGDHYLALEAYQFKGKL